MAKNRKRRPSIKFALVILFSIVTTISLVLFGNHASAASDSPWLSTTAPSLINDGTIAQMAPAATGNQPCTPTDFTINTLTWNGFPTQYTESECAVYTNYGLIGDDKIQLNGTKIAGKTNYLIVPIQNSSRALRMYLGVNNYMAFYDNVKQSIGSTSGQNNTTIYNLGPADSNLKDKAGNQLGAKGLSVSSNSKWIVTDAGAVSRVNLETKEVLPFHPSPSYNLGFDPGLNTAISSDGRFAVVYLGASGGYLKIYDLSTCAAVPDTIAGPVNCESKVLTSSLQQSIPGYIGISQPRFVNNNVLSFYAVYKDSSNITRYAKYRMVAPGQSATTLEYLGLGDSYSSGEGAYDYLTGTDESDNMCHLSHLSYPYLIGATLDMNSYESVACSGATAQHVSKHAQYDDSDDNLPGAQKQIDFVSAKRPDAITLTLGGNDIGFSDILRKCIGDGWAVDTCYATKEDRTELIRTINSKFDTYVDTYSKLKNESRTNTKIYVAGYPQIAKTNSTCGNNVRLDSSEITFASLLIDYLNSVIESAANKAGVRYVNVSDALINHRLCETDYSNTAVNGLTAGNDIGIGALKIIGNESYHPNTMGHRLLSSKIIAETSNLTQPMPAANSAATPPVESSTMPILNAPTSGRTIKKTIYQDSALSDVVLKSQSTTVNINNEDIALKKSANYTVQLHSTPISLGTIASDAQGNLNTTLTIPNTVSTGFHTLHIYGQNLANEDIDIYKVLYVGSSQNDLDGDGIINSSDKCLNMASTNQDIDQDGTDDGCDGYVNDSPTDINTLYRARSGSASSNEDLASIYVERSVAQSNNLLNISDIDADNDGWVTVGRTSGVTDGAVAHFWIEDKGPQEDRINKYVPHVSIRSATQGCLQFTPSTLTTVVDTSARPVTIEVENASTCRSAAPSADTDNNSIPDDEQALYRARNGNIANGESASEVYIERNIAAAEAILGISDYDDGSDGWAVIAKTNGTSNGTYANLVLADPETGNILSTDGKFTTAMRNLEKSKRIQITPIIALERTGDCHGIKPSSLAFVTNGSTRTTASASLPSELNCSQ